MVEIINDYSVYLTLYEKTTHYVKDKDSVYLAHGKFKSCEEVCFEKVCYLVKFELFNHKACSIAFRVEEESRIRHLEKILSVDDCYVFSFNHPNGTRYFKDLIFNTTTKQTIETENIKSYLT